MNMVYNTVLSRGGGISVLWPARFIRQLDEAIPDIPSESESSAMSHGTTKSI